MNKINFLSVDVEGFRTIVKPLHFDLNRSGLNMIKGVNGAGKTSVFEALYWCTYGENLKDVNQAQLISWPENRGSLWQGTKVSTTFQIENSTYEITRCLGYKGLVQDVKGEDGLFLAIDGVLQNKDRNKDMLQETINSLLGMNANVFINSILFGQRMSKLIQQSGSDKRELFETLFATEWIADCKTRCDADIALWNSDMTKLLYDISTSSTSIEHLIDKLSTAKETLASFNERQHDRILQKQGQLDETTVHVSEFGKSLTSLEKEQKGLKYDSARHDQLEADYKEVENSINAGKLDLVKAESLRREYEMNVKSAQRALEVSEKTKKDHEAKHIEGNCPYCAQELLPGNKLAETHKSVLQTVTYDVTLRKKELKQAETALKALPTPESKDTSALEQRLELIESELAVLDELYQKYDALNKKIDDLKRSEVQLKKDILRISTEIDDIKAEKAPVVDLKGIENAILDHQNKLETAQQNKLKIEKKLEIAKWFSTKAFGAGGLKAYVFSAMLTTLNSIVKKYGDRLGASLEFSIDLTKASKPFFTQCSLKDKLNKDYNSFSGGEKQRLDLCLMFAMFDLVSIGSDINLLILDECFEGLDEEGEGAVFDLLREKADSGKSIFVITHSATLDSLYANTIQLENRSGNTIITN